MYTFSVQSAGQQKNKLAAEITKAVMATLHYGEESVSIAMEEDLPGHSFTITWGMEVLLY